MTRLKVAVLGGGNGISAVLEGFARLVSAGLPLDVTAVYTSHGWNQTGVKPMYEGFAEDVESILPKRVK